MHTVLSRLILNVAEALLVEGAVGGELRCDLGHRLLSLVVEIL